MNCLIGAIKVMPLSMVGQTVLLSAFFPTNAHSYLVKTGNHQQVSTSL